MKVVITDYEFDNLQFEEEILKHDDIELIKVQCETEDEVIEHCHDADGIINQYAPITSRVVEQLNNCKIITRYGVGVDTIDIGAATEKGILIGNVPDYGVDEVSDHALALILGLLRKIDASSNTVKNGTWDINLFKPIYRLNTLTIGLIGFGNNARRLATKLQVLGIKIIANDPYLPPHIAEEKNIELVSLEELYKKSDLISVHVPLTESTKGMIGENQFKLMKDSAYVVNTARGPVIDESALVDALEKNIIGGVGLDVFETEPIDQNHPLLKMENTILTPHIAGYSEEATKEMRSKAALGVTDVLLYGEYPKYLVNKDIKEKVKLKEFAGGKRYAF